MVKSLTLRRILWFITLFCQSDRVVKLEIQLGKQLLCNLLAWGYEGYQGDGFRFFPFYEHEMISIRSLETHLSS